MSETSLAGSPAGLDVRRMSASELGELRASFDRDGYFVIKGLIPRDQMAQMHATLTEAFTAAQKDGSLFSGGGTLSGHLNCFPGVESRFLYDILKASGVMDLIRQIEPKVTGEPNVGCNYNLPGSTMQHYHTDYPFSKSFMIANFAVVDTIIANGAMQAAPGTHKKYYKYWQFAMENPKDTRVEMQQGDVMVRTSAMWHRGMPNMTNTARPMIALTWEDGGSKLADPFMKEGGKIKFFPNWFKPTPLGRIRERTFVAAPILYSTYRFVDSLFSDKGA